MYSLQEMIQSSAEYVKPELQYKLYEHAVILCEYMKCYLYRSISAKDQISYIIVGPKGNIILDDQNTSESSKLAHAFKIFGLYISQ